MHVAALVAALLSAAEPAQSGALAAPPAAEEPPRSAPAEATPKKDAPDKLLGIQLSLGVPDGFGASAIVRPLPWVRVDGGLAYNVLSLGLQGGVTVMPWTGRVTPTLRLGMGQFFESDVRDEVGSFPDALDPALRNFGYRFYTAQLGLELGDENGMQFFVRGGLAWVRSDLDSTTFVEGDTTVTAEDSDLSATVPSIQLGLLWHIW